MKKIVLFIVMITIFSLNVEAGSVKYCQKFASGSTCDSSDNLNSEYFSFKTEYEKGPQVNNISSKGNIVIYGHSVCNNGSCTYTYAGNFNDYKELLKRSVKCTGGEKNITFQSASDVKKDTSDNNYTGDTYWSEDYEIQCTNTASAGSLTPTGQQQNNNNNNNGNNGNDYGSAGTIDPAETGVETYYIILGIVGIITYLLTIVIKKQNLFKKV